MHYPVVFTFKNIGEENGEQGAETHQHYVYQSKKWVAVIKVSSWKTPATYFEMVFWRVTYWIKIKIIFFKNQRLEKSSGWRPSKGLSHRLQRCCSLQTKSTEPGVQASVCPTPVLPQWRKGALGDPTSLKTPFPETQKYLSRGIIGVVVGCCWCVLETKNIKLKCFFLIPCSWSQGKTQESLCFNS